MTRLALRRVPLFASLAVLIVLPMQVSPQEGASTGGEVARNDRVVAGDRVAVFGGLVLINHGSGWVSAYGHASRVDVVRGQKITRGQTIGLT